MSRGNSGCEDSFGRKAVATGVLDMDRPLEEVVRYVLDNPVRKGLVKDWREWPYAKIVDPWT
jgi:hypothetical protein